MSFPGGAELLVIVLVALVLFGPKRLPEIARTVGQGLRDFRRSSQGLRDELETSFRDPGPRAGTAVPPAGAAEQTLTVRPTQAVAPPPEQRPPQP